MTDHVLILNCWVMATWRSLFGPLPSLLVVASVELFKLTVSLIMGFYNVTFITQFMLIMDIRYTLYTTSRYMTLLTSLVHELEDRWIIACSSVISCLHCLPGLLDTLLVSWTVVWGGV